MSGKFSSSEFELVFAKLEALLACPTCHGDLHVKEERVVCTRCERVFPIVDGIPALVAER